MGIYKEPSEHPDFFDMTADEIIEKEITYPDYEGQHPLFKHFGVRTGGICDVWLQSDEWRELPEVDKWKYIALCALYWEQHYRYWCERAEHRAQEAELKAAGQTGDYIDLRALKKEE